MDPTCAVRHITLVLIAATIATAAAGCSQGQAAAIYPKADLSPPALLQAGPVDSRRVVVRFDEVVAPVVGSFASEPSADLTCLSEGANLTVSFEAGQSPGRDYALAGEVDDSCGNRARFLLRFTGWNDRAPSLRVSEVQTGKNSSKTKPHRDFIEFEALATGNIGGEEVSWASTVKTMTYRFPAAEVRKGDFVVLHLAPELLPEEVDEVGSDTAVSGGVDATSSGREILVRRPRIARRMRRDIHIASPWRGADGRPLLCSGRQIGSSRGRQSRGHRLCSGSVRSLALLGRQARMGGRLQVESLAFEIDLPEGGRRGRAFGMVHLRFGLSKPRRAQWRARGFRLDPRRVSDEPKGRFEKTAGQAGGQEAIRRASVAADTL